MNKTFNIINIILLALLAYAIMVAEVSEWLKQIAWALWWIIVIFSLVKFHLNWKKRKMKM